MVVRLETAEAFVLVIKDNDYNKEKTLYDCHMAEEKHLPMYLVAHEGVDITPLTNFPWRKNGVFIYRYEMDLIKILDIKIRADLRFIQSIGT